MIFKKGKEVYSEEGCKFKIGLIYDDKDILETIEKTFRNIDFQIIIRSIKLDSSTYNIHVMKLFKKDFWKEFI